MSHLGPTPKLIFPYTRMLPNFFRKRSRYGTPTTGILFSASGVILLSYLNFQDILAAENFLYRFGMIMEFIAFVKLQMQHPEASHPYKIPIDTTGAIMMCIPPTLIILVLAVASVKVMAITLLTVIIAPFNHVLNMRRRRDGCCSPLILIFPILSVSIAKIPHLRRNETFDVQPYNVGSRVVEGKMYLLQNLMERLRPIVGLKSWDYCVVWKLSDDQRFLEWVDCCCSGTDNIQNGGEECFLVSSGFHCRDVVFPHATTQSCDLLSQLSSPISLDSGMHAEALFSNQYRWLNFYNNVNSGALEETIGTRVLIPVPGGLVELFVGNQIAEDQNVIGFVTSQCSISMEQEATTMMNSNNTDTGFVENPDNNHFQQPPVSPVTALENINVPYDISVDRIRLCNSPMNFEDQQFNFSSENRNRNNIFSNGFEEMDPFQNSMDASNMHVHQLQEPMSNNNDQQEGNDKDSVKQETIRSDSISDCSDQMDDDDDAKYRRRTGKGPQSKNLLAERKRRKKLNDRLYSLRALVPKISKLDRASILGDAIEFVKELQKQEKDLQDELQENSDDEGVKKVSSAVNGGGSPNNVQQADVLNKQNGFNFHLGESGNGSVNPTKQNHDSDTTNDKVQQMEPQVEVAQIDGNEFFVKIFCEHRPGGFARLLEALNALGLEVTNANVTSFRSLVSNVFKVEKRDSEMVQADHVRDSLLELTKHPSGGRGQWQDMWKKPENGNGMEYHHHHHNGSYQHLHN